MGSCALIRRPARTATDSRPAGRRGPVRTSVRTRAPIERWSPRTAGINGDQCRSSADRPSRACGATGACGSGGRAATPRSYRSGCGGLQGSGQVVRHPAEVQLVRRQRDDDPLLGESPLDLGAEPVPHRPDQAGVGDERVEPEEQGRLAEAFQHRRRRRARSGRRRRAARSTAAGRRPGRGRSRRRRSSLIGTRRILSLSVQLTRLPVMNSRLGTIMLWLSPLMIVVARMLMRSTLPVVPATVTTSPMRIGRSSSRMMPQTKLETISWRPKPSPTPRAARTTPILARSRWIAPSAADRGQRQDGVAAEGDDGEPDAGVVGHPGEDRDGEEGAHVPPGQRPRPG